MFSFNIQFFIIRKLSLEQEAWLNMLDLNILSLLFLVNVMVLIVPGTGRCVSLAIFLPFGRA